MEQKELSVSVAMAVRNGLPYLEEQLQSILAQLQAQDEVIISLDPEDTDSKDYLAALSCPNLTVLQGEQSGVLPNFENALRHCNNEIILLADQDDVWLEGKVKALKEVFATEKKTLLVLHDATVVDGEKKCLHPSFFEMHGVHHGVLRNFSRNSFMGCCMAFRRELLDVALPFPPTIPMHDQWLGMIAEQADAVAFLPTPYLLWRRHGANASQTHHASLSLMLKRRLHLYRAWQKRKKQIREFIKNFRES